ncbi:NADH-quinone oxidoreductase subunit N [Buchnera aphidicola (Mollitrichosiphum nigrofasciatum)]|uniref:NADH-quinone oxidoreductase subunit N n=1 Tax=Buchnera aphidicola TaxID=9 RepID=UPI0031B8187C
MSKINLLQQIIALFPIIIIFFSILLIVFSISIYRNHLFVFSVSIICFFLSLFSIFIYNKLYVLPFYFIQYITIDYYSFFNEVIILLTSLFTCLFFYLRFKFVSINKEELYLLLLLSTLGAIILISTNNMMLLYISIELLFFPLFGLIGYFINYKNSLESVLKYIIWSSITSIFLLLGVSFIYLILGSFNIDHFIYFFDLLSLKDNCLLILGCLIILISLLCKLSIFPFYFWISDVYQGITFPVLIYFSIVAKIAVFSFLMNFFKNIPINYIQNIYYLIYILACFSVFLGNLIALMQNNIKSLLSYTSISHFGYILITLVAFYNKSLIFSTNYLYFLNYFLINIGIFGTLSTISNIFYINNNCNTISMYKGLFWKSPFLALSLTINLLSASGIPFTIGFISKFYLMFFLFNQKYFILVILMTISSVLGIYCYFKIIFPLFCYPANLLFRENYSICNLIINYFALFLIIFLIIFYGCYPKFLLILFNLH